MNKELVKAILCVLEQMKERKEIREQQGNELAGVYWIAVLEQLQHDGAAFPNTHGDLMVRNHSRVSYLIAQYTSILHELEKQEYERKLNEEYQRVHIKNVKRAYILSIIAVIVSIAAAVIALCQLQGWKL